MKQNLNPFINLITVTRLLVNRSLGRRGLLLVALFCFALAPIARAQLSPPPDGGYPNDNTAEGTFALANVDLSSTGGSDNVALGFAALFGDTTGSNNTATGFDALAGNKTGNNNTANGFDALVSNTTGSTNTATGAATLVNNTTGNENTAFGVAALNHITTGSGNSGIGVNALLNTTTASFNTAFGDGALYNNSTGGNGVQMKITGYSFARDTPKIYSMGAHTCSYLRDEAVDGEPAAVYRKQYKAGTGSTDATIWISKKSGRLLREEQDGNIPGKGKGHISYRWTGPKQ
jgi:hypothetical protein